MAARFLATILLFLLIPAQLLAGSTVVRQVRLSGDDTAARIVLDLNGPAEHRLLRLSNPPRVVVDLSRTRLGPRAVPAAGRGLVKGIRNGVRNGSDLRLVFDLERSVKPRSFLLKPDGRAGYRLVVDLQGQRASVASPARPVKHVAMAAAAPRDLVIAIDAGHGGKDPGARGRHGTKEKDVVLAIARKLKKRIDREPGMKAVLVRDGDRYLKLRQRIAIARRHQADLFVSIHADAVRDRKVRGSSVYVLSRRGASSEMARLLAESENKADLIGISGVKLEEEDATLRNVLLDLSQAASIEASMEVANNVIGELARFNRVHQRHVQQAGFVVLKAPDFPSMLVETAFISNPQDEKLLRSSAYQSQMAEAILRGIRRYFRTHAPPGTLLAARQHVIRRGDTLSGIAQRYGVGMELLKVANNLKSDRLRVGEVLRIPSEGG